jgi:hypothetical protein
VELWQLVLIIGLTGSASAAFLWMAYSLNRLIVNRENKDVPRQIANHATEVAVEYAFSDEFREELRVQGREQFHKIISENAMFLQQDMRLTASQLNEFMKQEIVQSLQEQFGKYEKSIDDAKQIAVVSLEKTRQAIEQQRLLLSSQLQDEMNKEKQRLIERFEQNMAEIINHYVLNAIADQISLEDQLEYIMADLEANKQVILEDIKNGA